MDEIRVDKLETKTDEHDKRITALEVTTAVVHSDMSKMTEALKDNTTALNGLAKRVTFGRGAFWMLMALGGLAASYKAIEFFMGKL